MNKVFLMPSLSLIMLVATGCYGSGKSTGFKAQSEITQLKKLATAIKERFEFAQVQRRFWTLPGKYQLKVYEEFYSKYVSQKNTTISGDLRGAVLCDMASTTLGRGPNQKYEYRALFAQLQELLWLSIAQGNLKQTAYIKKYFEDLLADSQSFIPLVLREAVYNDIKSYIK